MNKPLKNIAAILIGLIAGLILAELALRIYNPLPSRVTGTEIKLLANYDRDVNIKLGFQQAGLDERIHYSTNTIGFRGDDPPENFNDHFTIFTVGGSTTECSLLDDTKTWSFRLGQMLANQNASVWVNNAGIDGTSTYGHQVLLEEHIFQYQPDMIIFLVGVNEMWVSRANSEDDFLKTNQEFRLRKAAQRSALFSFFWNFYRQSFIKNREIGHSEYKTPELLSQDEFDEWYAFHEADQENYKSRLQQIISDCRDRNIQPVLVTQPIYGLKDLHPHYFVKLYNQSTKEVAEANAILLIDLAALLDDDPDYFYDTVHFTNLGSERVAEIIHDGLVNAGQF